MSLKEHLSRQAYYLTYESNPTPTIVFHVRRDTLGHIKRVVPDDNRYVEMALKRFNNAAHEPSYDKDWGLSRKTINRGIEDDFAVLAFPLQPFVYYGNNPCPKCKGSGRDIAIKDNKCYECSGIGKEQIHSDEQHKIVESMSLLLKYLEFPLLDNRDTGRFEQDIHFILVTHITRRSPIGGEISRWLFDQFAPFEKRAGSHYPDIIEVMGRVYAHLLVKDESGRRSFQDYCRAEMQRSGGFHLEVPMNATYLHVSDYGHNIYLPDGYKSMSDHNVDSSCDQISLFAGCVSLYHKILTTMLS